MHKKPTLLIISQTYVPDPAALGQYMHHVACEMVKRGYRVQVYASERGYEQPDQRYPKREQLDGVDIRRLPFCSFGKSSIAIRLLGGFFFVFQVMLLALWTRQLRAVLVSTSPPMASIAAIWLHWLRRVPITFWAMDINPDQMIAMGMTRADSIPARLFNAMIRQVLRSAQHVVALDRYMGQTLERKLPLGDKLIVLPPWPMDDAVQPVAHAQNPFRKEHQLDDQCVVMYSGNISPSHPIDTLLDAARLVQDDPKLQFVFIGGGLARSEIESYVQTHGLRNVLTLPYQPISQLSFSLSAADIHVVAMGDKMVGIVHPCKIYNAMAAGRPILLVGPAYSHAGDLIEQYAIGWQVAHGQTDELVQTLRAISHMPQEERDILGKQAHHAIETQLSQRLLRSQFCDMLEADMQC